LTARHPDVPEELRAEVGRLRHRAEAMPGAAEIAAARALATPASGATAAGIDARGVRVLALRVQADDLLERLAGLLTETC
jgi:hypothetical protein